ncbi:hypothetical protein VOLCADRAFT_107195 [Volvox carteri f. nagariensis]|uniref:Uncharacterized protein n=1 Tax=Volvox carteri f. nagariensis TaxID=3068 RepID=D8UCJ0_VOLCA|nr:uncharacterized protein VOLCADRAFT_107195 [Volvox carteri f. nagariensis]EFJ42560.1 hypothetical protein VOLCADRAFT_107195 [Volvox carteri f. nagariensis]|eukprot:XP_002956416.1 hypothetical protein VOLCADRAFT_107195 [Volvox carteri f. nagariensis]
MAYSAMSPRPMAYSARESINYRAQPWLTIQACDSRRAVVVHSRQRGFGSESLEHAIQIINKLIFEHEQRRQRQRARRADAKGGMEVDVQPVGKPITFKASASTEKLVKEPRGPSFPPRSLSAYLALPLDQYSLLDPGWISRSPSAPDVFVLRVPLFDLVGLELQPQITVRVSLDTRSNQVHFYADQFKVGDPRFDADFKLAMKATLRNKPVPTLRPLRSIKRMWARAGGRGGGGGGGGGKAAADLGAVGGGGSADASPVGQRAASAATGSYGNGGDAGSPARSDADEDDIVITVIDVDGVDDGSGRPSGSSSGGGAGEEKSRYGSFVDGGHRHRAAHGAYGSYEAAEVVDVEMAAGSFPPGSRAVPNVSQLEIVVHDQEASPAAVTIAEAGRGPADATSQSTAAMGPAPATGPVTASQASAAAARPLPVAAGPPNVRHPAVAVATTAAPAGSPRELPSVAPFVEDAVLYVPANQWGRAVVSGQSGSGTSRTAASAPTGAATVTARAVAAVVPVATTSSAKADADARPAGADALDSDVTLAGPGSTSWSALGSADVRSRDGLKEAGARSSRSSAAVGVQSTMAAYRATGLAGAATGATQDQEGGSGGGRGSSTRTVGSSTEGAIMPSTEPTAAAETTTAVETAAAAVAPSTNGAAAVHGSPAVNSSATAAATSMPPGAATAAHSLSGAASEQHVAESTASSSSISTATTTTNNTNSNSNNSTSGSGAQGDLPSTASPPSAAESSAQLSGEPAAANPFVAAGGGGAAAAEEDATALLVGSVDVAMTVMLPPALATVPRPLLRMAGNLIARYAIASLLPSFLDLLVADYGRWSSGQTVAARAAPVGSLAAVAAANASPMRAAAPGARTPQQGGQVQQKKPEQE